MQRLFFAQRRFLGIEDRKMPYIIGVAVMLQRPGAIDGTLVGFSFPPAVRARRTQGIVTSNVFATVEGATFHLRGLSAGPYQVAAIGAEADAATVVVVAGQTGSVILRTRTATTIRGRVVDWSSGAGVAGVRCVAGLRCGNGEPMWLSAVSAFSDEKGGFVLEGVPTGDIAVGCLPTTYFWSMGRADLTLSSEQEATCEVPVVKIDPDVPPSQLGAMIQPYDMPVRFGSVVPHGPADRAGVRDGDVVLMVDGASVTALSPTGVLTLLGRHAPGTAVHLRLGRSGQAFDADVVAAPQ
jgi:hypothetical protein